MPYEFYKVLHIVSVILVLLGLTAWLYSGKRSFSILHGVALLLVLVSGFGLAARLGMMSGLPGWVWVKLTVWVLLGAAAVFVKKKTLAPGIQVFLWIVLASVAICMAVYKPALS